MKEFKKSRVEENARIEDGVYVSLDQLEETMKTMTTEEFVLRCVHRTLITNTSCPYAYGLYLLS
eukprot:CAMPEP_0182442822 /NCGR_PEP_ID=MMETSP1172-20130603/1693_1 /TAXON_ID=708627 /ORGANISM="Timspurckia oligopyrenoides, Strain CCMP3278" /LENGTH=63 /DNA_ID=CAMNT_0024637869 /DNA_START=1233 /DNA_END=1421 /DNA_ORIENTATION=+